jgi:hypothetical protein
VSVKGGENARQTLSHSGVVRMLVKATNAGGADGPAAATLTLDPPWTRNHLRLVAFEQARSSRAVTALGRAPLGSAP